MTTITRKHDVHGDRYLYDFQLCRSVDGWAQVDTSQDASYYGTWANPFTLTVVGYCEGDVTISRHATAAEFVDDLLGMKAWNEDSGHRFIGIDGMCRPEIIERFEEIGLGDLLH